MKTLISIASAAFLAILLFSSIEIQSEPLVVRYLPTVTKEGEPFTLMIILNNPNHNPQRYLINLYVNGEQLSSAEARLDPETTRYFTYTRASPKIGEAIRIYAEAINLETGEKHTSHLNIPQNPPELWMSFLAFSSFTTTLTSTSTTTLTTLTYYLNTMGITQEANAQQPINPGIAVSITLILLLIFIELTDPAYGKIERRILALRERYGTLSASLLLIFTGIVLTKVVTIIAS
ncbi:hypothetical protein H5T51_02065 [Candidatus Bathyarchaeota archaeon]|nr:hypothetical protein [Candidatus Bathyarchaeota archaeon]